ncbi:hypothetical protein [Corynebacterium sp. H130]|uniref:hypothetical protein n=1 Tax=Corynebacterium sp. H130 TaxID=3133444 RepID=UPI00309B3C31
MNFQPGYDVDPTRVQLSEKREEAGFLPLTATLLKQDGGAFLLSIDGRPPVWAWLHDPGLVSQLFEWFSEWGFARYDEQFGLLKVWSGSFLAIACPRIAAPGQRDDSGEFLAEVMKRSVGVLG